MTYVLVMKNGNSLKIGRKRYSKEEAIQRQLELKEKGIKFDVMEENEAFGLN